MFEKDFPVLENNKELIYLDSGATTLTHKNVIAAIVNYHTKNKSNVHRGFYSIAEKATEDYENVRGIVKKFFKTDNAQVVFTSGTTDSLNKLAWGLALSLKLNENDIVVISEAEHHANIVPWHIISETFGLSIILVPVLEDGSINLEVLEKTLRKAKGKSIISISHVSNTIGFANNLQIISSLIRREDTFLIIDAAQSVGKIELDLDFENSFLVFSGHKVYGPTGTGCIIGSMKNLSRLCPVFGGGDMIESVKWQNIEWAKVPYKLEPGTPNIAGIIGMGEALKWIQKIGIETIDSHLDSLTKYTLKKLEKIDEIEIFKPGKKHGLVSFFMKKKNSLDIATLLGSLNIAVRSGYLCAQPIVEKTVKEGIVRVSLGIYNNEKDVDKFIEGIIRTKSIL